MPRLGAKQELRFTYIQCLITQSSHEELKGKCAQLTSTTSIQLMGDNYVN